MSWQIEYDEAKDDFRIVNNKTGRSGSVNSADALALVEALVKRGETNAARSLHAAVFVEMCKKHGFKNFELRGNI